MNIRSATPDHGTDPRIRDLHRTLDRLQRQLRAREAAALMPRAMFVSLAAALVVAGLSRLRPVEWPLLLTSVILLPAAGVAASAAYALLRPRDHMWTARRADHLLSLDERLSTALEDAARFSPGTGGQLPPLLGAQLGDALAAAARISPGRDLPVRLPARAFAPAFAALVLLLAAFFAPIPGLGPSPEEQAVQRQINSERAQIEEIKKAIQAQPGGDDPARKAMLNELDQLLRDLSGGSLSREESLARLSDAQSKLEKVLDPQGAARREALDALARQLQGASSPEARQAGEQLRQGNGEKASGALKQLSENLNSLSEQERKELARTLREARDAAAPLDPEMARQLNQTAGALESGNLDAAREAIEDLGSRVQEAARSAATQEQINQALSQVQQSKENIAQAGKPTPSPGTPAGTAVAGTGATPQGTPGQAGTAQAAPGTPLAGTSVAMPQPAQSGTPPAGTPVALGSPVGGTPGATGTPVLVQSTPGTGTPAAAQGQGQGQGQGGQQGQGQNSGQGQGQGQGQSGQGQATGGTSAGPGWGKGHSESVYAPAGGANLPSTPVTLQGQNNPGGESSTGTANTDANTRGEAQVPYGQVYGQYKEQAGKALNSDYIPQGYKDLVRDYFTSIDPER